MGRSEFREGLERLILRVEAWSYADSDAGAGQPTELARALQSLASIAPNPALMAGGRRAQAALDDGLSPEAPAAALYGVRTDLDARLAQDALPPSSGRRSAQRRQPPNRGP